MFTVSEICLRFPKYVYGFRNMWTVSDIYVPYPGVGSHAPSAPDASCQAPKTPTFALLPFMVTKVTKGAVGGLPVMDSQVQCAVVTLVISNCLKKLSCPSVYFVRQPVSR